MNVYNKNLTLRIIGFLCRGDIPYNPRLRALPLRILLRW